MESDPSSVPSTSSSKTSATRPMPLWTLDLPDPSTVTTPADSWPRCWSAYMERNASSAAASEPLTATMPHSSRGLSSSNAPPPAPSAPVVGSLLMT